MDQMNEKQLPEKFSSVFADVPPLPGHLYGAITLKIIHRKIIVRSVWAAAATLVIAVSLFTAFRTPAQAVSYSPEVADELVSISSYYNSSDIADDDESIYENVFYLP